jgi:hypothetical protein
MKCLRITNSVKWQILLLRETSYYRFIDLTTQGDNSDSFGGLCDATFSEEVEVWADLFTSAEFAGRAPEVEITSSSFSIFSSIRWGRGVVPTVK